jgi:hypothetical protein
MTSYLGYPILFEALLVQHFSDGRLVFDNGQGQAILSRPEIS